MSCFVAGYDLSGDIGQLDAIESTRDMLDVTTINDSGKERIHSHMHGRLAFTGFFDDGALLEHVALKLIPTADVIGTVFFSSTIGDVAYGVTGKRFNYPMNRGADGSLTIQTEIVSNADNGNYGKSLTAGKRTDTAGTNGAGVDFGVGSTAFGAVFYAHVFSVTGTSITLTIQESSDDGSTDPFANVTGGAFTAVLAAAVGSQRLETSLTQTVERYLRVVSSGTFNPATFAVMGKRYASASAEL